MGQRVNPDDYIDPKGDLEIRLGIGVGIPSGLNLLSLFSYDASPARSPRLVLTYHRATQIVSPPRLRAVATVHAPELKPQPVSLQLLKLTVRVNPPSGLAFDGVDDEVAILRSPLINSDANGYVTKTIEVRFRTDDAQSTQILYEQGGGAHGYNTEISGGMLRMSQWRDNGIPHTVSVPISSNTLYHAALVHDGDAAGDKLLGYLDGALVGAAVGLASVPSHGDARIGAIQSNTKLADGTDVLEPNHAFSGSVFEHRHWNAARSQAQIQAALDVDLIGDEAGLALLYKLNDGSGAVASDSTANGLHGAISGAAWTSVYGPAYVGLAVLPPAVAVSATAHAPSLSGGTVTITPPKIGIAATVHTPEVLPQTVIIEPPHLVVSATVHTLRVERMLQSVAVRRRVGGLMLSGERGALRYEPYLFLSNIHGDEVRPLPGVITASVDLSNFRDHTWELFLECEATDAFNPLHDYVLAAMEVKVAGDASCVESGEKTTYGGQEYEVLAVKPGVPEEYADTPISDYSYLGIDIRTGAESQGTPQSAAMDCMGQWDIIAVNVYEPGATLANTIPIFASPEAEAAYSEALMQEVTEGSVE